MATFQQPPPPPYSVAMQQPPIQLQPMTQSPPTKVVLIQQPQLQQVPSTTVNVIAGTRGNCRHCQTGNVVPLRNTFWLVVLVVLALLTFPFGLVFCCFIPFCTWDRVCTHCRRSS